MYLVKEKDKGIFRVYRKERTVARSRPDRSLNYDRHKILPRAYNWDNSYNNPILYKRCKFGCCNQDDYELLQITNLIIVGPHPWQSHLTKPVKGR